MGRDDARPVTGLHGGTAPARAFADFMKQAVANRPIEQFDTQVTLPEWQLEPDEESYFGQPDNGAAMVDPDGNPLPPQQPVVGDEQDGDGTTPPAPGQPQQPRSQPQQQLDDLIDRVTGRDGQPRDDRRDVPPGRQPLPRGELQQQRQPDDRPTQ